MAKLKKIIVKDVDLSSKKIKVNENVKELADTYLEWCETVTKDDMNLLVENALEEYIQDDKDFMKFLKELKK